MKIYCPTDHATSLIANKLYIEYWKHPKTHIKASYLYMLRSHSYMGQMVLTFRYTTKDHIKIKRMLEQVYLAVSNKLYGRNAFNKDRKKNSVKFVAVIERNSFDDGRHVHLLIIPPDEEFIKPEFKDVSLNQICLLIKEKWISLGGGIKGEHKCFNSIDHLDNTLEYLMKQYDVDGDNMIFDYAPAYKKQNKNFYK